MLEIELFKYDGEFAVFWKEGEIAEEDELLLRLEFIGDVPTKDVVRTGRRQPMRETELSIVFVILKDRISSEERESAIFTSMSCGTRTRSHGSI